MGLKFFCVIFTVIIINYSLVSCRIIKSYKAAERPLDPDGKYLLAWEVDDKKERVTFHASVQTTGYVGLGISPNGGMQGADIFIGGVDSQNKPYFSDRHGVGLTTPVLDSHNDWDLTHAAEDNGWTNLTFTRLVNTCDNEDVPITYETTTRLIYSYGASDDLAHHGANRGSVPTSILDQELDTGLISSKFKSWNVTVNMEMPNADTSYWCTIHKRESFGGLRHVVGFDAFLENNTTAKKHTHHLVLHKCHPPAEATAEETFEEFVNHPGEECYDFEGESRFPKTLCTEYMFIWATGGKTTLFPDDVGHPIEETPEESPYFMLEIHYDNPEKLRDVTFQTGVTVYYTDALRQKEAGLMTMGNDLGPSLTVPPNAENFVLSGHCSGYCTSRFSKEGINVFNVLLHSHLSARQMRVRHFRGIKELPWLYSDPSYDFNFQQNKALKQHVNVLPGDHLITECTYNSQWNKGYVVKGGFKTTEEMCTSHIWYYPRVKTLDLCTSAYNLDQNFKDFGITEYEISINPNGPIRILAPPEMAGLSYVEAISTKFNWTEEFRKDFQNKRRYGEQEQICAVISEGPEIDGTLAKFPGNFIEYVPAETCGNAALKVIPGINSLLIIAFLFYFNVVFCSSWYQ